MQSRLASLHHLCGIVDMMIQTEHPYIVRQDGILGGEPTIKGTRTSVRSVVLQWRLLGDVAEIPRHLPHLSMAAVFDALSYYSDHTEEINEYIERNRVPPELAGKLLSGADLKKLKGK